MTTYTPVRFVSCVMMLSLCGYCATAQLTWNGQGDGTDWHDPDNWDDDREPASDDDVVIPGSSGAHVVIEDDDAACRTISMPGGVSPADLTITGKTLTLGEDESTTSSWISVTLQMDDNDDPAIIAVRHWVRFTDSSSIQATVGDPSDVWCQIVRATDGLGIITEDGTFVEGHLHFLCSVKHDATGGFFGVSDDNGNVMKSPWLTAQS